MLCVFVHVQVDKILDSFYEYMDDRDRWHEAGVVKVSTASADAACAAGYLHDTLYTAVLGTMLAESVS